MSRANRYDKKILNEKERTGGERIEKYAYQIFGGVMVYCDRASCCAACVADTRETGMVGILVEKTRCAENATSHFYL